MPNDWDQSELGDINCPNDVDYWAEHYWTADLTFEVTQANLTHAHNIDITEIDQKIKDHNFPWKWYTATVTGEYPKWKWLDNKKLVTNINGFGYGFARSREAGDPNNWDTSMALEMGNNAIEMKK